MVSRCQGYGTVNVRVNGIIDGKLAQKIFRGEAGVGFQVAEVHLAKG